MINTILWRDIAGVILEFLSPQDTPDAVLALPTRFSTTKQWIQSLQQKHIVKNGYEIRVHGWFHAEDEPAIVTTDTIRWYKWGVLHRVNGPALKGSDGSEKWCLEGKKHCVDGPALVLKTGTKFWYVNNKLHRTDGPAIEGCRGSKHWYYEDQRHRMDGPAIEMHWGTKVWYVHDRKHRQDGPAVEQADGKTEYWVNGEQIINQREDKTN